MSDDHQEEFWDRLEDIRAGMLEVRGAFLPMSHSVEPEDGNLWFITAKGTQMAEAGAKSEEARYIVSDSAHGLHAEVKGRLEISNDRAKLDQVWSAVAASWFEDGKDDPDLVLLRFKPSSAEVWLGPESGLHFLYELLKSKMSKSKPDYGKKFSLRLG